MTQFQTSIYDLPGQLVQQTARGNLAPMDSLLSPDSMSPAQRQSLYQSVTGGGYGNRILDTLGEIATSPWLYIMLATGPVGQKALKAGKGLMEVAASKNAYAKKNLTLLESAGLMMPDAPDDFMTAAVNVQNHLMQSAEESMKIVAPAQKGLLEYLAKKHGVPTTTLNPDDYLHPKFKALREDLRLIHTSMGARAMQLEGEVQNYHDVATWNGSKTLNKSGDYLPLDPQLDEHLKRVVGSLNSTPAALVELNKIEKQMQEAANRSLRDSLKAIGNQPELSTSKVPSAQDKIDHQKALREWKQKRAEIFETYNRKTPYSLAHDFNVTRVPRENRQALVQSNKLGDVFAAPEVENYYQALQQRIRHGYVKMLGDESVMFQNGRIRQDTFIFDDQKLLNMTTRIRNGESFMVEGQEVQGKELLGMLVGVDRSDKLWKELDAASKLKAPKFIEMPDGSFARATSQEMDAYRRAKIERGDRARDQAITRIKGHLFPDGWGSDMAPRVSKRLERVQTPEGFKHPTQVDLSLEEQASKDLGYGVGRITPRTDAVPEYNTDDLEFLNQHKMLTDEGRKHLAEVRESAQRRYTTGVLKGQPHTTYTLALDLEDMAAKASVEMHRAAALDAPNPIGHMNPAGVSPSHQGIGVKTGWDHSTTKPSPIPVDRVWIDENFKTVRETLPIGTPVAKNEPMPSNYTVLLQSMRWVQDPRRQQAMKDLHIPAMLGLHDEQTLARMASIRTQKEWVGKLAESKIGELMETHGGEIGKNFRASLRQFAAPDTRLSGARTLSERMSNLLYMSHMGLNASMPVLNLMQPLISAAQITTPGGAMKAYGRAMKQIFGYMKDRIASGQVFMSDVERAKLIEKNIDNANHLGITPDFMRTIESHVDPSMKPMGKASRFMMTMFEKSEWFNRVVAHELIKEAYTTAGRGGEIGSAHFMRDLSKFSASTQYSGGALYTPPVFMPHRSDAIKNAGVLSNPVAKMFMSFGLRTATTFFSDAPKWGGEESYLKGLATTGLRSLAISGLVYEVGKGLFGVDMSRGLAASAATDVFGGQKAMYTDSWYPTPPILRIPSALLQGLAGNKTELASGLAALIPGGIALSRALSVMPDLPLMGGGLLQKQYADYSNMQPDGTVPVYKPDGTVVAFRKPSELILRGLGVDLGAYNVQSNVDGYLIKQRQEIVRYRHEYLRRLAGNDISGADAIKREFGSKFQDPETGSPLPLTVTQTQVRQYLRARSNVGRTERILDSLPPDARPQFAHMLEQGGMGGGVDLESGDTAGTRTRDNPAMQQAAETIFLNSQKVGPGAAVGSLAPTGPGR